MTFTWLKRYVPKSLYGRAFIILLLPVVVLQVVVSVAFVQRLFEDVTRQLTGNVAYELRYVLDRIDAAPDVETARATARVVGAEFDIIARLPDPAPLTANARRFYDLSGRLVIPTLNDRLGGVSGIDLATDDGIVDLTARTAYGPLRLTFDRDRVSAQNPHQLPVIMVLTALLMTVVAYLFMKNQLRPIKRLGDAAAAFGRGRSVAYHPSGAQEVRAAGTAFLDMRARIERQIEQRTMMLSGISHDLRTPLTRLNLGLELSDDPDAPAMRRDVAEMRGMLDAFLDFAREGTMAAPSEADPVAILRDVVEKAGRGGGAVAEGRVDPLRSAMLNPLAVGRALENLLGNALRYGSTARVSLEVSERALVYVVEDDGPGIPAEARDKAMRAFARLDDARNQNSGAGVGLGLAIAQDVARQHGGVLRLDRSEGMGGLRADLVLAR